MTSRERLLQALLDESVDGLIALNERGTIAGLNEQAARIFGRRRPFLHGKPFVSLIPVSERRAFRHAFRKAVAGEEARLTIALPSDEMGAVLRRAAPTESLYVTVRLTVDDRTLLPAPTHQGPDAERVFRRFPYGVLGVNRDLTVSFLNPFARQLLGLSAADVGQPLTEGEFRAFVEHAQRTRLSTPAEIIQNGKELRVTHVPAQGDDPAIVLVEDTARVRVSDRVTAEFIRNASHQLRTPLTAFSAAIEALQSGAKDDPVERERFLAHIADHVARMTRLTHGLLVLSRARSGLQAVRLDFVELAPVVERLAAQSRAADGVAIETACTPGLTALGDADLLEETLAALLDNAVAHTREGSIRITATQEDWDARIQVEDTGSGILPEHRERIFEPFYRPWYGAEGFGLGLAIARQAVEAMDGRIEIGEADGGGTRVLVHLPSARVVV